MTLVRRSTTPMCRRCVRWPDWSCDGSPSTQCSARPTNSTDRPRSILPPVKRRSTRIEVGIWILKFFKFQAINIRLNYFDACGMFFEPSLCSCHLRLTIWWSFSSNCVRLWQPQENAWSATGRRGLSVRPHAAKGFVCVPESTNSQSKPRCSTAKDRWPRNSSAMHKSPFARVSDLLNATKYGLNWKLQSYF